MAKGFGSHSTRARVCLEGQAARSRHGCARSRRAEEARKPQWTWRQQVCNMNLTSTRTSRYIYICHTQKAIEPSLDQFVKFRILGYCSTFYFYLAISAQSWINQTQNVILVISNQTVQLVFFCLHLILRARIARFDVMDTVALFGKNFRELNKGQQ